MKNMRGMTITDMRKWLEASGASYYDATELYAESVRLWEAKQWEERVIIEKNNANACLNLLKRSEADKNNMK